LEQIVDAGRKLRSLRESLRLSVRDVESASIRLAEKYQNPDFAIAPSRLSDMETKGVLPNLYRLYSLGVIYRHDPREILSWFGVPLENMLEDFDVTQSAKTHLIGSIDQHGSVTLPIKMDPGFDLRVTANVGRFIEQWGVIPLLQLRERVNSNYTYGYIGLEDFTMYPLLLPGSFIQVDESKNKVVHQQWNSEYARPIYFVETRESFLCCWCRTRGDEIVLESHPLSPVPPKIMREGEAEVLGQVVGIAMRLGDEIRFEQVHRGRKQLN
jgi:hypothetical protein